MRAGLRKTLLRDLLIWLVCGLAALRLGSYADANSGQLIDGILHWFLLLSVVFVPVMLYQIVAALYQPTPPQPGFCRTCGYNLTGNVSGICPECGKPVANDGEPIQQPR